MEDSIDQNIKFDTSLLSFEDSDKKFVNINASTTTKDNDINNKTILIDEKSHEVINIEKKKITCNSKINLCASVILLIFSLIFIPFYSIAESYLIYFEKTKLIVSLNKIASYDTLNSSSLKHLFGFFNFFLKKDFLAGFLCFLYTILHPFVAMKIIYGVNFSYCILVFLQLVYQSRRPIWENDPNEKDSIFGNQMIICESTFSNPSIPLFNFMFCLLYSLYSYMHFYSYPKKHMNVILKIVLFVLFISFIIAEIIFLLIYRLHYLHELIFTVCLTLILICFLIAFENKFRKIIFNATKNFFKLRKNKIKIFLYILFELVGGIAIYNLIGTKFSRYQIEENIMNSKACSTQQKIELSISNSFMEFPFIFSLLGEFWGASLTLEYKTTEWWYQSEKFFYSKTTNNLLKERNKSNAKLILFIILKGIITLGFFIGFCFLFDCIPYINYPFNFTMQCLKYFIIFFVCTGVLPLVYGLIGMNNKHLDSSKKLDEILEENDESNNLFKSSLFVKYFDKLRIPLFTGNTRIHYSQLYSNDELDDNEAKNKEIDSKVEMINFESDN